MGETQYQAILLFGPPGCGKGTQGAVLGKFPNFVHVASGDIFRGLSPQSAIGREFKSYSSKGLLVPDELTVRVWLRHMQGLVNLEQFIPEYHVLISDGIPRTTSQVDLLRDHLNVLRVLSLEIEETRLIERLKGRAIKENRLDDTDENVIRKRIAVYRESTEPVLKKYPPDRIIRINADQHPLLVARDIFTACVGLTATVV